MSVSSNLLCSFELLKPLDSSALKSHIKKGRNQRNNAINSPVSGALPEPRSPANINSLHKYQHRASNWLATTTSNGHQNELWISGELHVIREPLGNGMPTLTSVLGRTVV